MRSRGVANGGMDTFEPPFRGAIDKLHGFEDDDLSAFIIEAVRREPKILAAYFSAYAEREKQMINAGITKNIRLIKNHSQLLAALDTLAPLIHMPDEIQAATADFITGMCAERHTALSADHPIVQDFWETFNYLVQVELDGNVDTPTIDHSRDPNNISINLKQFEERCAQRRLQLPPMQELRRHLKTSRNPKFIGDKAVNSRHGKTLHCWVFQRTPTTRKD